jgi:hypothetical protein
VMDIQSALWHDYRKTWEAFSRHTSAVHKLAGSTDRAALEAEMRQADLALLEHKEARGLLAAAMVPALAAPRGWSTKQGPGAHPGWSACHESGTSTNLTLG